MKTGYYILNRIAVVQSAVTMIHQRQLEQIIHKAVN